MFVIRYIKYFRIWRNSRRLAKLNRSALIAFGPLLLIMLAAG